MLELERNGTKWDIISELDGEIRLFSISGITVKLLELFHKNIVDKGYAKLFVKNYTLAFATGTTFKNDSFSIIAGRETITLSSSKEDTINFITGWIAKLKPKIASSSLMDTLDKHLRDAFSSEPSSTEASKTIKDLFDGMKNNDDIESKGIGFDKDKFAANMTKIFSQISTQSGLTPENVEDTTTKLNKAMENISKFVTE